MLKRNNFTSSEAWKKYLQDMDKWKQKQKRDLKTAKVPKKQK